MARPTRPCLRRGGTEWVPAPAISWPDVCCGAAEIAAWGRAELSQNAVLDCQEWHANTIWQRPSGGSYRRGPGGPGGEPADERRTRRRRDALAVGPGGGPRLVRRRGPGSPLGTAQGPDSP